MCTLYMSISGGIDWSDAMSALEPLSEGYAILFVVFISTSVIAALNIVTGVFVESAMTRSLHDKETIIQEESDKATQQMDVMIEIFREIDVDGTGEISISEFERRLEDERALAYFSAL